MCSFEMGNSEWETKPLQLSIWEQHLELGSFDIVMGHREQQYLGRRSPCDRRQLAVQRMLLWFLLNAGCHCRLSLPGVQPSQSLVKKDIFGRSKLGSRKTRWNVWMDTTYLSGAHGFGNSHLCTHPTLCCSCGSFLLFFLSFGETW